MGWLKLRLWALRGAIFDISKKQIIIVVIVKNFMIRS
jgi:hypothetical protein